MPELESSPVALDCRDPFNCLDIAMAKPGEEIRVIERVDGNPTAAKLVDAVGALSNDGKFSVTVTREDGSQQAHDFCYRDLLKTLADLDPNLPSQTRLGNFEHSA